MAFKFILSCTLLAICNAALQSAPQLIQQSLYASEKADQERYAPAIYDFAYSVHDAKTGDIKSQQESRRGDVVEGQYSLLDADGLTRIVDYRADDATGFNAHVRRQPGNLLALPAKPAAASSGLSSINLLPGQKPIGSLQSQPALLNFQSIQFGKPNAITAQKPLAIQASPATIAHQSSSFGLPLALAPQSASLALGHQTLPFAISHQSAAPLAVAHQLTPLAALPASSSLAQHSIIAQPANSLLYSQGAHLLHGANIYSHGAQLNHLPYAIAHSAPIAYQTSPHLSSILTPAALAIHH